MKSLSHIDPDPKENKKKQEIPKNLQAAAPPPPAPPLFLRKTKTLVVLGFWWPVMDNLHFRYVRN